MRGTEERSASTFSLAMTSTGGGLESLTSQRGRNNCLTVEMENGAPPNYLANRNAPTMVYPGAGGMASDLTA